MLISNSEIFRCGMYGLAYVLLSGFYSVQGQRFFVLCYLVASLDKVFALPKPWFYILCILYSQYLTN